MLSGQRENCHKNFAHVARLTSCTLWITCPLGRRHHLSVTSLRIIETVTVVNLICFPGEEKDYYLHSMGRGWSGPWSRSYVENCAPKADLWLLLCLQSSLWRTESSFHTYLIMNFKIFINTQISRFLGQLIERVLFLNPCLTKLM